MVIPAMVMLAAVLLASAQVPPLSARVIVTTSLVLQALAEQFRKPVGRPIVGVAGTVKAELKLAVMVLPAARCPEAEVLKPTVQVEEAPNSTNQLQQFNGGSRR